MKVAIVFLRLLTRGLTATARSNGTNGKDPEKAKQYNHEKNRLTLIGLVTSIVAGGLFVFSGKPADIRRWARSRSRNRYTQRSLAVLAFAVIDLIAQLPLSYYRGYTLEHRYDLSNQTRLAWFKDQIKGLALVIPFTVVITNGMLWLIERWPRRWWAIATAISLPFTVLLAQLAPVLIAPLFNKYEPLKDRELAERLKELAGRSGIKVADVLQMDMSRQTKKANAFFTGIGQTKRIVLADTLLENFTTPEIEVIVAHEIAHQAHRDLWRFITLGTVFTAGVSFLIDRTARLILARAAGKIGTKQLADIAAIPLLSWLTSLIGLALTPVQNAYSRRIERRADTYALTLTRDPQAFISAMERLGDMNLSDPNPSALVRYTLYSHPPLAERIERGREFAQEHQIAAD